MKNAYIEEEAIKGFENWTKEGWEFLLQNEDYKQLAISTLAKILDLYQKVEFRYNNLYYEVFVSGVENGYMINIYSNSQKDEDGYFMDENMVDGGLCTGNSCDALVYSLNLKLGIS